MQSMRIWVPHELLCRMLAEAIACVWFMAIQSRGYELIMCADVMYVLLS